MSYVEVLILRHLMRGPAHGYELRKHVEEGAGVALNNNALYPALRRFEEAGAVTKVSEQQVGRPARHVYTLTEVGREMLQDMLTELPSGADETEFLTRVAQFAMLTPEERAGVLAAREGAVRARAEFLRALLGRATGETWGIRVSEELIRRCEAELAWLRELGAAAVREPVRPEGE
ncbi:PadR family transcriptional regulator [Nocardia sp. NPDC004068]|uniref:PadR family transcriptional regulator n=1 Tax=Nocardia sp. NPDC004068 TaxID=3364303 RepID=UPI0036A71B2F